MMASRFKEKAIEDDIQDTYTTVYFVIKYSKPLLEQAASASRHSQGAKTTIDPSLIALNLRDEITKLLLDQSFELYHKSDMKIRFVATVEETVTCKASFHLTNDPNPFHKCAQLFNPVMIITIKGGVNVIDKLSKKHNLTKCQLYDIYTNTLIKTITDPERYNLKKEDILIDRIEMVCEEEETLIQELMSKIRPEDLTEDLSLTRKELEKAKKHIEDLETKQSHQCSEIQTLQEQMKRLMFDEVDELEESLTSSLTASSTRSKGRRKKKSNKQQT